MSEEAPRAGWMVVEEGALHSHGHYLVPQKRRKKAVMVALCSGIVVRRPWRPWSVVGDVGVVHLCEGCKAGLREA